MTLEVFFFFFTFTNSFLSTQMSSETNWVFNHRFAYALMFFAYLWLFTISFMIRHGKKISHVVFTFAIVNSLIVSIFFSVYISIADYIQGEQIFVFVTIAVLISTLFFIKPYVAIILITFDFALFYIAMLKSPIGVSLATNSNLPVLYILLVCVHGLRYRNFLKIAENAVKMSHISRYDALTETKNRYALKQDVQNFYNHEIILMMTDVDNFKVINDKNGHEKGDEILKSFALMLKENFEEESCYRYGGDEFMIVLPSEKLDEFKKSVEKCYEEKFNFNFSGGYVIGKPNSLGDFEQLMIQADANLYKAKENGKNQVYCN